MKKRKSIKLVAVIVLVTLFALQISIISFAKTPISFPCENIFVNDFANVISEDEELRLIENATALFNSYGGIEIVVTTISTLEGYTLEDFYSEEFLETCNEEELEMLVEDLPSKFATEMYNQYQIGTNDMGILILLIVEDGYIEVQTGKSMEAYISNSKAGRFIDEYALDSFKEQKFSEGLINLQEAFISELKNRIVPDFESETTSNPERSIASNSDVDASQKSAFFPLFVLVVVLAVVCIIFGVFYLHGEKKDLHNQLSYSYDLAKELSNAISGIQESHHSELDALKKKLQDENDSLCKKYSNKIESLNKNISDLSHESEILNSRLQELQSSYSVLQDRYTRVLQLYPNADDEVSKIIEEEIRQSHIEKAAAFDKLISKVIDIPANMDAIPEISSALSAYSSLEDAQKAYVNSDIGKLKNLYDESLSLKAEYERCQEIERNKNLAAVAMASITTIIGFISFGKANDLRKLKEAKLIYDKLPSSAKPYADDSIINKLNRLIKEATDDKIRKEREEREEHERIRREEERRRDHEEMERRLMEERRRQR